MVTFIASFLFLVLGYVLYGAFVNKVFGADPQRTAPCYTSKDGVDYMPMATWKVFLIQFLNIAGTGPIFGAIQGILFGPAAYFWIVLGCVFGGAVHDYMSGMISMRKNGASLPEIIGDELGAGARFVLRILTLVLMILVGTVFVTTPADLLDGMMADNGFLWSKYFWVLIIFVYYLMATLLPIDKLIGKIYPIFGIALLIMAVGLLYGIFAYDGTIPEITEAFSNHHPSSTIPLFPGLCITIACGAVSGFHATQSPMMARCMKNEKYGRPVFYGAMIAEGKPSPAVLVNALCTNWLGGVGAVLAVLGVVAAPITSGDTAFRSARLISADFMKYKQNKIYKRLILSLPLFAVSAALMFINFDILWRYFAWFNQTLACITLWTITVWLTKRSATEGTKPYAYLITLLPSLWMTIVCSTYIFIAPEGFQLTHLVSYILGGSITVGLLVWYIIWAKKLANKKIANN